MTSFYSLCAEHRRNNPPPPLDEVERQRIREERDAQVDADRKARFAHRYRVLVPGTLVKVPISWLRGRWLKVRRDEGPASDPDRRVVVERIESGRKGEIHECRRDRLLVKEDIERLPDVAAAAAKLASPAKKTGETLATDVTVDAAAGRSGVPLTTKGSKRNGIHAAKSAVTG